MEFHADWLPFPSDEDIEMMLDGKRRPLIHPVSNYIVCYGPSASSLTPLVKLFDLKNYRSRRTLAALDPISPIGGLPMHFKGVPFKVELRGDPFFAESDFAIGSQWRRPFDSYC